MSGEDLESGNNDWQNNSSHNRIFSFIGLVKGLYMDSYRSRITLFYY